MPFYKSISSLRALAVVFVVLYHFKIPGFHAGFIGVDLFFVISGFLMTRLIIGGLQAERFSLIAFYAARARRIIPALALLCLTLTLLGYFFLATDDYRELLRTIKESLLFSSNHYFARDGSYFDAPLHENWLLHTWSLSVEWQFYLLYPLILMALAKCCAMHTLKWLVAVLGVCSLALSSVYSFSHPVASFFYLPTRAWEMIAGGLVFLFPMSLSPRGKSVCESAGLFVIAGSMIGLSADMAWPGYMALLPVIGAALVIQANANSAFAVTPPLQYLGKISYSVYLWHWPLVVMLYTCGLLDSTTAVGCAILLTLALGALSYHAVEARTRTLTRPALGLLRYAGIGVLVTAIAVITGSVIKHQPALRWVQDEEQPHLKSVLYTQHCNSNAFGADECVLGEGTINAIILGDSHAQSTAAALMLENPGAALGWARAGCPTLLDFQMGNKEVEDPCKRFNADKFSQLEQAYPGVPLFLFSRAGLYSDQRRPSGYSLYFAGNTHQKAPAYERSFIQAYTDTVCSLAKQRPVYVLKPVPEMPFNVFKGLNLHKRIFGDSTDISAPLEDYFERNRLALKAIETATAHCNVIALDPVPYLCPDGECLGSKDGVPLYFDDNHLVDAGNQQIRRVFSGLLNRP